MEGDLTREDRRDRQHQAVRDEIKAAAWRQISKKGASALSFRAVAASLGLSAPALYRYFPNKNSLVTALIIEAFDSLAASQHEVLEKCSREPWEEQLRGLGKAYRQWALAQPAAFLLIFGDPVPGYTVPFEETMLPAGQSLRALIHVIDLAYQSGDLKLPLNPPASASLSASLKGWSDAVHKIHPDVLYMAFVISTRVQGMMLVELGRQLPPFFADGRDLYERELARIIEEIKAHNLP